MNEGVDQGWEASYASKVDQTLFIRQPLHAYKPLRCASSYKSPCVLLPKTG